MDAPVSRETTRATFLHSEPQLFVSAIEAAIDFYAALGFEPRFKYGEPSFYAQIVRDQVRLNLRHADGSIFDATFRVREPDALSATIVVDDAEALFREYRERGVAFFQDLRSEPWGARTFIVADPDGNLLLFAG